MKSRLHHSPITFDRSILDGLPDPEEVMWPIRAGMVAPEQHEGPDAVVKFIGGLHNLSQADKLRWGTDASKDLLIVEVNSDRAELYPKMNFGRNSYRIQVVTFTNTKKGLTIHSHDRYHDSHSPQPAIIYTTGMSRGGSAINTVSVFVRNGRLDSRDFWIRDNDTHNYNILSRRYVHQYPVEHDFMQSIIFTDLRERWKENEHVSTTYGTMEIILKNPQKQEEGKLTSQEWVEQHCKFGFYPLRDDPFESETDEFHFLTDMAW